MLVLSILVFFIARLSPGDPLKSYYGESVERMSESQKDKARERLGLNEPMTVQYIRWVENALHGDFGISYKYKQDVGAVIEKVYANTLILGGLSYVLTFLFAVLLGIFCAMRENTLIDRCICKIGTVTNCIPSFWCEPGCAAHQRCLCPGRGTFPGRQARASDPAGDRYGVIPSMVLHLYGKK